MLCSEIFVDSDQDGVKDPEEPALGGVTVSISGPLETTAVTDRTGTYCVEVPAGEYTVTIVKGVPDRYSYLTNQSVKIKVLGASAERNVATFRVAPLAFTGARTGRVVGAALSVIFAGALLVGASRRRRPVTARG